MRIKAYKLPLRRKDGTVRAYALVSPEDYATLGQERWHLSQDGYAVRKPGGRGSKPVFLHREVLGLGPGTRGGGVQTDHINRNRLDNRRENLRTVTVQENRQNITPWGRSKYRGVYWHGHSGKWRAAAKIGGKVESFGYFLNEEDAAEAALAGRLAGMSHAHD